MLSIKQMPDNARVWVFQSTNALSDEEVSTIQKAGIDFITNWTAHGASLKASFDILYNRFIIISVDEQQALASGCSIDKSVHFIKNLETQFHLNLFDRMQVAYRTGNEIKACHLNNLRDELLHSMVPNMTNKEALGEVIVFNNMVTTKKEFENSWETSLKKSWQSRILTT
jgi:hypothetical protein